MHILFMTSLIVTVYNLLPPLLTVPEVLSLNMRRMLCTHGTALLLFLRPQDHYGKEQKKAQISGDLSLLVRATLC